MLALYLLASHLVGDFVLQTRWQATGKLEDARLRERHCFTYALAFVPLAAWRTWTGGPLPSWRCLVFLCALITLHYLTDSRRFRSTLGDVIAWRVGAPTVNYMPIPLEPNPWTPLPILIDQTLHVVQLAALGWLLT